MIKDERIRATIHRSAARGFAIWYVLLFIALLYRNFHLHQPVKEHWDITVVFFVGTIYVFLSFINKGVYAGHFNKKMIRIVLGAVTAILAVNYFQGNYHSIADFGEDILTMAFYLTLLIPILLYTRTYFQ